MYKNIKQTIVLILFACIEISIFSQYRTEAFNNSIKTIQVLSSDNNPFTLPIIELNSSKQLLISFDELSHNIHSYYYRVEHCNADWTPSDISPLVWADGFTTDLSIYDVQISQNTTYNYTHYAVTLPNDELQFKVSGNYTLSVYEDNDPYNIVATACFSIVEDLVNINATIHANTNIEIKGKYQQLDFSILPGSYPIDNPMSELKVVVQQNGRYDNMVTELSPTYTSGGKISYTNNKALIFEGGNEYHLFDISSIYAYGENVNTMQFFAPFYHAELLPDKIDPYAPYIYYQDANGKFIINIQEYNDDDTWADYILAHFTLPTDKPFFDGQIYLISGFNNNQLNSVVRMNYNTKQQAYEKTVLLKQGGYNFLYGFVQKGSSKASTQRIESSHWETENEYAIYVYHRGFGGRYDKLIGVEILQSNK